MDTADAPQILEHVNSTLAFTPFDVKWIPQSARFCLFGQSPSAKGVFNIYQLDQGKLNLISEDWRNMCLLELKEMIGKHTKDMFVIKKKKHRNDENNEIDDCSTRQNKRQK